MRGFTVGMLVSVGLLLTAPPALAQGSGASDWSLYWWDDFDGTTLNTAKWTPVDNCDDQRNNEEQCYRAAAVSVSNGSLVITSTRDQYRGFDFTSGAVKTETTFVAEPPVRVEFRARLPRGGWGLWPALWLYPTTTWPPEIDVLEAVNDMHTIWQNYHWGTWPDTQSVLSATWVGTSEAAFHTYAVEWEPDAIRWYVDDTLTKTVTAHVSAVPMQLYINTALGGSWPGPVPASTVFPQTLAVDYVRVYTRGTPDSSVDREGPTVALSSPSAGSFVNGSVMLQAVADDNVGVQAVWFTVDDQSTGGEDTRAPYQRTWDSRTVPNGTHTVRGHARDAAGNTQASAPVTVTVSNAVADTTGPSVAVISPADGSTVSGYLTLSASADDP